MHVHSIVSILIVSGFFLVTDSSEPLQKRQSFTIPLPLLTLLFDSNNNFEEAFVTFGTNGEGWAIGPVDDRYVKDTRQERVDHFYRELATCSYYISPFEAKIIERVCKKFEETLVLYEKDLKNNEWDRLLYLDGYFPVFMRGFFYLYSGAHNSFSALPKVTRIADSLYEESFTSFKSDARISTWRENPEHVVKLRIAAKELGYQMKEWRTKVLTDPEIDLMRQDKSKKFRESYELFVRLYFNLPPAVIMKKKLF